jgi:hypothetical protein
MVYNNGREIELKIILENKKSYNDFLSQFEYINIENFLIGDKIYYGLKNKNNLDIIPKEEKIVFDDQYSIVGLDFAVIAYKQMAGRYYDLLVQKKIAPNSIINNSLLFPVRSQTGLNFSGIQEKNADDFNLKIINNLDLNLQTINIKEYSKTYIKNIPNLSIPIQTHLKYIRSKYSYFNTNGITFTLSADDFNNDQLKVRFMSDLNFPVLRKLCEQYGFYIDENAPWQLVTNLSHPNIKKILNQSVDEVSDTTPEGILKKYYNVLLYIDYESQKNFFYNSYKKLYDRRDSFSSPFFCAKKQTTLLETFSRDNPPDIESFISKENELFFMKNYLKILNVENNNKYDLVKLEKIFKQASKIYTKELDKAKTLVYILGNFEKLIP